MSWLLDILRCILFCGEADEPVRYRYYSARETAEFENGLLQRSPPNPSDACPSWRPPRSPLPSAPPRREALQSSLNPSSPSRRSPLPSPPQREALQSSLNPSSPSRLPSSFLSHDQLKKASPSLPPSIKAEPAPLPSSRPSPSSSLSSKAFPTPTPLSPSWVSPTSPSLPRSSQAIPSSPLIPTASKTLFAPHPASKASPTPTPCSPSWVSPTSPSLPRSSQAIPSSPSIPTASKTVFAPHPASKASPSPSPPPPVPSKVLPSPLPSSKASPNVSRLSQQRDEYNGKSPDSSSIKQKSELPRYEIPNHLKELIKMDKVPSVLRSPLTPSTYADYFASLLYAEDFYYEKWSKFLLSAVTLKLHSRATFENARDTNKMSKSVPTKKKDFVAFEIDSVPERRPFLLSRDFVFVRPSGKKTEPFKGILYRVVKSTTVLVEFEDDFHAQHSSTKNYDVSFSFNRVCLKRSHHAVSAAKHPSLQNMLFPDARSNPSFLYSPPFTTPSHIGLKQILNHKGALPYLIEGPLSTIPMDFIEGPLSTIPMDQLSNTGSFIREAVLQIYSNTPQCRILICSPRNRTCDALMRSFHKEIPESKLFRANAAFREYKLVPDDIKPACLYEGECFICPPLSELQNFKIITVTFMSSFRLHSAGITDDHFSHIFLVDASSATEPDTVVTIANLVSEKTVVVVTGSPRDLPGLVRSDIARRHGLKKSYFHRLLEREPYKSRDPKFVTFLI